MGKLWHEASTYIFFNVVNLVAMESKMEGIEGSFILEEPLKKKKSIYTGRMILSSPQSKSNV